MRCELQVYKVLTQNLPLFVVGVVFQSGGAIILRHTPSVTRIITGGPKDRIVWQVRWLDGDGYIAENQCFVASPKIGQPLAQLSTGVCCRDVRIHNF